jgi:hypothetical protein
LWVGGLGRGFGFDWDDCFLRLWARDGYRAFGIGLCGMIGLGYVGKDILYMCAHWLFTQDLGTLLLSHGICATSEVG